MPKSFAELGISAQLLKGLADLNITKPTEIQREAIPILLNQTEDFVGLAKTGTGKTIAFGLPLLQLINLESNAIQAVILVPTRELGHQIFSNLESLAKHIPSISIASICGGIPIKPQIERLTNPTHIVVATPGRLIDLIKRKAIAIKQAKYLVLDEADEMVTSLKESLDEIIAELPKSRRTFLFSATLPSTIKQLIQKYMSKHIIQIEVDMKTVGNQEIDHQFIVVQPIEKLNILMYFLTSKAGEQGIIFCKTKAAVAKLAKNLAINRFSCGALHGSLSQAIRDRIMGQFREGHIKILVATDLAARGLDVKDVSYVVNYHLPDIAETYVHRSGRTARAGAKGLSLTILQEDEEEKLAGFQQILGIDFKELEKPTSQSVDDNNAILWAKQLFKTKPNHDISSDLKNEIKTIFHHLTKDELIEKIVAHYMIQHRD